jgi:hypothetical protein
VSSSLLLEQIQEELLDQATDEVIEGIIDSIF